MGAQTRRPSGRAAAMLLACLLCSAGGIAAKPADFERMKMDFASEMSRSLGLDAGYVQRTMASAEYRQSIIDAISRPAERKPWYQYRPLFVNSGRAMGGIEFWEENADLLARAEETFGVPPEIIVAIIGVETRYGKHVGRYPVVDALSTLAFGYPKRAAFFRKQLEHFLLLSLEENIPPSDANGSYAGAMGKPQFIPSSYRSYAVDFDGDGRRDLWNSNADVIGSVGAYFQRHGWQRNGPVAVVARGAGANHDKLVEAGMKPSLSMDALQAAGLQVDTALPHGALASLVKLETEDGAEYWVGLNNFYVITRYNHSNLYAMAVYQLSREILRLKASGKSSGDST